MIRWQSFGQTLLLFAILIFVGCATRKKTHPTIPESKRETTQGPSSGDSLYNAINASDLKAEWFSAKVSASAVIDKDSRSFSASLRMRKDSAIWLSISPALGIEVARVLITKDSVKFINRIEGTYFSGNYQFLNDLLQIDLNFKMVQAILLGNSYLHYTVENYTGVLENGEYILSTLRKRKISKAEELSIPQVLSQEIWFSSTLKKITRMEMKDYRPVRDFLVNYKNFGDVENVTIPSSLEIIANAKKQVKIQLDYSKITVSKTLNFPFNIPQNYEPIH